MKMHIIAAALATASTSASPVQHWYTEDSRSSACVTLETAYRDLGGPHTPGQLLRKLGRSYEIVTTDSAVVILAVPGTNVSILLFSTQKACNDVLQDLLRSHGSSARG